MSVKLHNYNMVTIYYRSELCGGHKWSAATMPLHVVCRGEECRSVTSVSVLNVKAVVAAFNQEKALVGAFSVIMNLRMDLSLNHTRHLLAG